LYRQRGLSIRRRWRRAREVRNPLLQPIRPGQCWSMDLMGDSLADGRAYRTFNVIGDYARDALAIEIDVSLAAQRVLRVLERLCEWHSAPESIRGDNRPEFHADLIQNRAKTKGHLPGLHPSRCPRLERMHRAFQRYLSHRSARCKPVRGIGRALASSPGNRWWSSTNSAPAAPSLTCRCWRSNDDGSHDCFQK